MLCSAYSIRLRLVLALVLTSVSAGAASRADKLVRLLALEEQRSLGAGEIERALSDGDAGVRRRAALAAGRIGDPSLVPALATRLGDSEVEVRQMAAFGLGLIGDPSAKARLIAALSDGEPVVRARAAEALGRLGDRAAAGEVARMVIAALPRGAKLITVRGDDPKSPADPWLELRLGLLALAALGDARAAESVLLADGQARFDWWAAAYAAAEIRSPALRAACLAATRSSDPTCRAFGARGLGALKGPDAVDALEPLTADTDQTVALEALHSLASIADARAAQVAMSALASQRPAVKQAALEVLAVAPVDRGLREQIAALIGHPDPGVRAAAVQALAAIDPQQLAFVLSGTDPDPVWFVRSALARAAGAIGGDLGLGLAFAALQDRDARVAPSALETLRRLKGADAADTLRKQLDQPDVGVRATAIAELAALKPADLSAVLGKAYTRAREDEEPYVRAAIVGAAAREPGEAATSLLSDAAQKDPSAAVRRLAAGALVRRGSAPLVSPPDRARAFVDYRVALAPFAPVPDLPLFTPRMFLRTARGAIEVHLNVVEAPLACAAFVGLARRGFFNDQSFERSASGLVLEGGCPRGDGFGGPGFTLPREVGQYAFGRGAVALVPLAGLPDSAGSRFLITREPTPTLDGHATLLGWVVSGWETLESLRPGDALERVEVWDGR